jgi:hypothetical protein
MSTEAKATDQPHPAPPLDPNVLAKAHADAITALCGALPSLLNFKVGYGNDAAAKSAFERIENSHQYLMNLTFR